MYVSLFSICHLRKKFARHQIGFYDLSREIVKFSLSSFKLRDIVEYLAAHSINDETMYCRK